MDDGLTLEVVAARFDDSERLLVAARERLERLAIAEERTKVSSESLATAADEVRAFAGSARDVVAALTASQQQVREVLEAGAKVLDGQAVSELHAAVVSLQTEVPARLAELESRIGAKDEAEQRAVELERAKSAALLDLEASRERTTAAEHRATGAEARVSELERLIEHFKATQGRAYDKAMKKPPEH